MAEQHAHVTNFEALDAFRTALIRFLEKAKISLNEVSDEVTRTRVWVNSDQALYWKAEIRKYNRKLEDARQAVFSAELSAMRETSSAEERLAKQVREKLRGCEDKLRTTQKFARNFDATVDPLAKSADRLRSFFEMEMPKAMAFLNNSIKALDAYASVSARPAESGAAAPASAPGSATTAEESTPPSSSL